MMSNQQFTDDEIGVLNTLVLGTRDDPRKHGLIGTCFWKPNFTQEDQEKVQVIFSSIVEKLNSWKIQPGVGAEQKDRSSDPGYQQRPK